MKKRLLFALAIVSLLGASCSKCYDCRTQVEITDGNGNVISTEERTEEVCTASKDEVDDKESEGYDCS